MTVKVEVIEGGVPHNKIMIAGLVATLVCLYLTWLNVVTGTQMFAFFDGLARTVNRIPESRRTLRRIFGSALIRHPTLLPVIAKYFA